MTSLIHKNIVVVCICCLSMLASCATVPTIEGNGEFSLTRHAIGHVKNKNLRRDLHNIVDGVEYGLATGDEELASRNLETLASMAFFMNRTITPKIATVILECMLDEGPKVGMVPQIWSYKITKHENHYCSSATCQSRQGTTCWSLENGEGCADQRGSSFPWQAQR